MLSPSATTAVLVRRGLELIRLANGQGRKTSDEFRRMLKELRGIIPGASSLNRKRMVGLLTDIRAIVEASYSRISKEQGALLDEIVAKEAEFVQRALGLERSADPRALSRAAKDLTVFGQSAAQIWSAQANNLSNRIGAQVQQGASTNADDGQLLANALGDSSPMPAAMRDADAITEAIILSGANASRMATWEENDITAIQWSAILDGKLCPVCGARHRLRWKIPSFSPIGHDLPIVSLPPMHPRCRCVTVPMQLADLTDDGGGMESFDDFLSSIPDAEAEEILGKGRAALYFARKISLRDLVGQGGRVLALRDLR